MKTKRPVRLTVKHLILTCLFFISGILLFPVSSPGATVTVETIHSVDQYPAEESYPILFRLRISSPWYVHGTGDSGEGLIPTVMSFPGSPDARLDGLRFPLPEKKKFDYTKEPVEVFSGDILVKARLMVNEKAQPGPHELKGMLSYQACSSKVCLPPESIPVTISLLIAPKGTQAGIKNREMFDTGNDDSSINGSVPGWSMGAGFWVTLLVVFLGGLALNLTPCVYPLIPITVSYFGGRSDKMKGRTVIHGILYILGLAFTNSLLGLAAGLSGGMLGSVLQNPIVLMVVAGILISLALSFFGLWELRMPSGLTRVASRSFGGYFGTFFMGLTLGIVAAPCLGPFILGLLTYVGQKGDPLLGFLYFFVLSIGMGLPLSLLAIFSGTLEKLPVSGAWMVWIRKLLGWVLVGMAAYLIQPLIPEPYWRPALFSAILIGAGLHLGWIDKTTGRTALFAYIKRGLSALLIGAAVLLLLVASPDENGGISWIPYNQILLTRAAQENRPVIVDFYADWCAPCRAMEKEVFGDPRVAKEGSHFLMMRVDLTSRHPRQKEILRHYRIRGVPTIVFINGRGDEERALRIETYTGTDEVLKRMKRLRSKSP